MIMVRPKLTLCSLTIIPLARDFPENTVLYRQKKYFLKLKTNNMYLLNNTNVTLYNVYIELHTAYTHILYYF